MSKQVSSVEDLLLEYQDLPEFQGTALTSVNQRGGFMSTPLHIAIYRERPAEVQLLLRAEADPNAAGEYGETPIQVAVRHRNKEIVHQLVKAGARCDIEDQKGVDAWTVAEIFGFKSDLENIVAEEIRQN